MTRRCLILVVASVWLHASAGVSAHHSFAAEFDASKPVSITGTVTRIEWMNPHAWFYVDVTSGAEVVNWGMELGSPNGLMRAGWQRDSMKPGDIVTVEGFGARRRDRIVKAQVVILAGTGQRLFAASSLGQ